MAANFMNRISMQPMRSCVMECKGLPFSLVSGGKRGGLLFSSVTKVTVDNPLSMQALFICLFFRFGGRGGGG